MTAKGRVNCGLRVLTTAGERRLRAAEGRRPARLAHTGGFQHRQDGRMGGTSTPVTRHSQEWDSGSRGESVRTHCKGTRLLDGTSHGTCAMCTQHRLGFHHRAAPDGGSWAWPARVSLRGPVGGVDARWPWARGHSVLGWHRTISILHTSPQHPLVPLPCLVRPLPRVRTRPCSLRALGSA